MNTLSLSCSVCTWLWDSRVQPHDCFTSACVLQIKGCFIWSEDACICMQCDHFRKAFCSEDVSKLTESDHFSAGKISHDLERSLLLTVVRMWAFELCIKTLILDLISSCWADEKRDIIVSKDSLQSTLLCNHHHYTIQSCGSIMFCPASLRCPALFNRVVPLCFV